MMMDAHMNGIVEERDTQRKRRSSTTTIELMVYVDAAVQNDARQNGFSPIDYVLGIINIVSDMISVVQSNVPYPVSEGPSSVHKAKISVT